MKARIQDRSFVQRWGLFKDGIRNPFLKFMERDLGPDNHGSKRPHGKAARDEKRQ